MDDLISRQDALDAIRKGYPDVINSEYKDGLRIGTDRAIYHVEKLPSAQPELILCRDCRHWREGGVYSYCQKLFNCGVLDVHDYMRAEDDFCSLAERREENDQYTGNKLAEGLRAKSR